MLHKLLALTALSAAAVTEAKISPEMKTNLENIQRDGIKADSSMGRHLISKARRVEEDAGNDMSYVADYSIKFMGCHHVTQWASDEEVEENGDQDEDEAMTTLNAANGRIRSKGLVRFRLCPSDSCSDHFSQGCSSNYGEYVVDMYQFLEVYVAWQMEAAEANCATYRNTCYSDCFESSNANCYSKCYAKYGVDASLCSSYNEDGGNDGGFDLETYIGCSEYDIQNADGEEIASYLGPYCASQGGEIRLGFFMDEYCSIASTYQAGYYTKMTGMEVPYTTSSLVSNNCISCQATADEQNAQQNQDYYNYDADGNQNYYVATAVSNMCGTLYMQSGKCESNMDSNVLPYPEEGACVYIDSVKALKNDGIIRSDQRASSRPASIAIGIFSAMAVLMGGYVVYLKGKISKSRVNLAGATASLA